MALLSFVDVGISGIAAAIPKNIIKNYENTFLQECFEKQIIDS